MSEFSRLVSESLGLFKAKQHEQCHEKLAIAFELSWEDGLKVDKKFEGMVILGLKMWFRTSRVCAPEELVHVHFI